jgi:hypothetical protein
VITIDDSPPTLPNLIMPEDMREAIEDMCRGWTSAPTRVAGGGEAPASAAPDCQDEGANATPAAQRKEARRRPTQYAPFSKQLRSGIVGSAPSIPSSTTPTSQPEHGGNPSTADEDEAAAPPQSITLVMDMDPEEPEQGQIPSDPPGPAQGDGVAFFPK